MTIKGYLGIDVGTQGLSVVLADSDLRVLAVGESNYAMVAGLAEACYEQRPQDWLLALSSAMDDLRSKLTAATQVWDVLAIGVSGQMHGEVLVDRDDQVLCPARLWCDGRNEAEGRELTGLLNTKFPKRMTAARWLWTLRNRAQLAECVVRITTPAGWISNQLTGNWDLGIGDASGMFPIDQATLDYDQNLLEQFDQRVHGTGVPPLKRLLPRVRMAGEEAGVLNTTAAELLGLTAGIPVAPAEGDQPAALAGSMIGEAGAVAASFGTSVCVNAVGDRPFQGVSQMIDHFCAVDGKPINMVFLRNGTTFMNSVIKMFARVAQQDHDSFAAIIQQAVHAPADCGGLLALPFMDDEPGLGIARGGMAGFFGFDPVNGLPGHVIKAALMASIFNLKMGVDVLDRQSLPRTRMVLTGGLTRTPELAQILADVFATPVEVPPGSDEGTAVGSACLAKYRLNRMQCAGAVTWTEFLADQRKTEGIVFQPCPENTIEYLQVYDRYRQLVDRFRCVTA